MHAKREGGIYWGATILEARNRTLWLFPFLHSGLAQAEVAGSGSVRQPASPVASFWVLRTCWQHEAAAPTAELPLSSSSKHPPTLLIHRGCVD